MTWFPRLVAVNQVRKVADFFDYQLNETEYQMNPSNESHCASTKCLHVENVDSAIENESEHNIFQIGLQQSTCLQDMHNIIQDVIHPLEYTVPTDEGFKKRQKIRKKQHLCPHCGKSFYNRSDVERHVRVHTGERPFKCEQCGRAFSLQGNLTSHKINVHKVMI